VTTGRPSAPTRSLSPESAVMTDTGAPIHPSLVRADLTLGVERHVAGVEVTLCFAVLFGARVSLASLLLVGLIVFVIHPAMVWITTSDPEVTAVYARSLRYGDFYVPHGLPWSRSSGCRPSIPRVR
jgi:type IV secretory pathway TrbD component